MENLYKKKFGNQGEDMACDYLKNLGYEIIQRNFRFSREGEIDIIAQHKNILIFIEVKTRTNHSYGDPVEQISPKKRKNWRKAAEGYLYIKNIYNQECRFDAIAIDIFPNSTPRITHIENAM